MHAVLKCPVTALPHFLWCYSSELLQWSTGLLTDGWYCFCLSCDYIGTQPSSAFQNIPRLRKFLSAGRTKWRQEIPLNMWDHPPTTNSFTFSRLIWIVTSTFCTSEYRSCNNVFADLFPVSTVVVRVSLQHFSKTMLSV